MQRVRLRTSYLLLIIFAVVVQPRQALATNEPIWTRSLHLPDSFWTLDVKTDPFENVYVAGGAPGLVGDVSWGGFDAFLIKFDAHGSKLWARQFGTAGADQAYGIATDGTGQIVAVGTTTSSLAGSNVGFEDCFVRKYDAEGNALWTRQFGSPLSDRASGVAIDSNGNVLVTGYVHDLGDHIPPEADVFLRKYDAAGNLSWERIFGSPYIDFAVRVSVDSDGNAYLCGDTDVDSTGKRIGQNAFVSKFSADGTELWSHQFGQRGSGNAADIVADSSDNVYLAGQSAGKAYLRKVDPDGNSVWNVELPYYSWGNSVAIDGHGKVYFAGSKDGVSFLEVYNTSGSKISALEYPNALLSPYIPIIAADQFGGVYALNQTWLEQSLGFVIVKLTVPEPSVTGIPVTFAMLVATYRAKRKLLCKCQH